MGKWLYLLSACLVKIKRYLWYSFLSLLIAIKGDLQLANNSYSAKYNLNKEASLKEALVKDGFIIKPFDHAFWRAQSKDVNATLYKSGKILVQGKGTDAFTVKYLQVTPQLALGLPGSSVSNDAEFSHNYTSWIGTDESGKGDYFGPLIIAGVLVDQDNIEKIKAIGVKDSKKLTDEQIEKMAWQIKANSTFSVVTITPKTYNDLYSKFNNLNKLLAWGHARAIENILEKKECKHAISDKFGDESLIKNALLKKGRDIVLEQRVRAESDIAVAAASIVARNEFVQGIKKLSKDYGVELPKGASQKVTDQANLFISKYDTNLLGSIAKLHFKTTKGLNKTVSVL